MKRKTMMVSIGCVLIFLVVGMIWYWAGEVRPLKDIDEIGRASCRERV